MRAARDRAPGSSPSHLGPPKARIPGLVWARRAPLMLMMRAPAVRIMKSRPRAEAASSNLLALQRAAHKPAPTPHGTRARFAAIHQLISSFRVRAGDPALARITSISGTLAARRRRVGGLCRPRFLKLRLYGFAKLWRPKAAATEAAHCVRGPIYRGPNFGFRVQSITNTVSCSTTAASACISTGKTHSHHGPLLHNTLIPEP